MLFYFEKCDSKKLGLPGVYLGPRGFRKVREACRNNFHLISCNMDSVVKSYDQNIEFVHEYQIHDYFRLSVTLKTYVLFVFLIKSVLGGCLGAF